MRSFPGGGRSALIESFRAGEERALARAISVVEDQAPDFEALLDELRSSVGRARRIGITGPPGAGKSTLTARFARLLRNEGNRVGIIAVDPTSPFTGGALLGDRIRMAELAIEPGIFIRSMASRGSVGGLATAATEAADLMDAFGFDRVILETLGVGQSELESGDGIQAMKAGLMEVADVFCVNKADRPGADRLVKEIEVMKAIRAGRTMRGIPRHHARIAVGSGSAELDLPASDEEESRSEDSLSVWEVPVLKTIATEGEGIDELAESIDGHFEALRATGELETRRTHALLDQTRRILVRRAETSALRAWKAVESEFLEELLAGRMTPYAVAERLDREK
jgi:LAO/AO transport system kinase